MLSVQPSQNARDYTPDAMRLHAYGLNVIPIKPDPKAPYGRWQHLKEGKQSEEEVSRSFYGQYVGIAMICANGIEAIDFDLKHDPNKDIQTRWKQALSGTIAETELRKCVFQKTKSGGFHVIYRTNKAQGNQKLCRLKTSKEAVIETRGLGGLLHIAPTPNYEVIFGDFANLQTISDEARDIFIAAARSLDECPEREERSFERQLPQTQIGETTVWDDFNRRNSVTAIAEKNGWRVKVQNGSHIYLTKPGSKSGDIHASVVKSRTDGTELFYPFTTATELDANKCYSAFALYAKFEHRGDFSAAAKDLYAQGYGSRATTQKQAEFKDVEEGQKQQAKKIDEKEAQEVYKRMLSNAYEYTKEFKRAKPVFVLETASGPQVIAGEGQIITVTGQQGVGKTFALSCMLSAAFCKTSILGIRTFSRGKKIAYFDTEQPYQFYMDAQNRIIELAGLDRRPANYESFRTRDIESKAQRYYIIKNYIETTENLGIVVLDGVADMIDNFNDIQQSSALVYQLMRWADQKNVLIVCVLHFNPGTRKIKGTLGSRLSELSDHIMVCSSQKQEDGFEYSIECEKCRYGHFETITYRRERGQLMPIWNRVKTQPFHNYDFESIDESNEPHAASIADLELPPMPVFQNSFSNRIEPDDEPPF